MCQILYALSITMNNTFSYYPLILTCIIIYSKKEISIRPHILNRNRPSRFMRIFTIKTKKKENLNEKKEKLIFNLNLIAKNKLFWVRKVMFPFHFSFVKETINSIIKWKDHNLSG